MKIKNIIIFGSSGLIGRYLFNNLKEQGHNVIGTYNKNRKEDLIKFDVSNFNSDYNILNGMDHAVLCSAVTKIDDCKNNPEATKINVESLERLILESYSRNVTPVFISGSAVFNDGGANEESERNPLNEYGKHKVLIEDFIKEQKKNHLIIRYGKVFGTKKEDGGVFYDMFEKYKKDQEIKCAFDESLSLTSVNDATKGLISLMNMNKTGVYHIDSDIYDNRLNFANRFFRYLNLDQNKIIPISIEDLKLKENRNKNNYLDSSKFRLETGFEFMNLEDCFKEINKELQKLKLI